MIIGEGLRQYELIFILSPKLEGIDLEKTKQEISDTIAKYGGGINFKESEKKTLAYPINKQGQGIFLISQVSILPENIIHLSKQLKLNKQVLRYIINQFEAPRLETKKPKIAKKVTIPKKKLITEKVKSPSPPTSEGKLEEIDKKLDELIDKI